jgi:hypothetical protein
VSTEGQGRRILFAVLVAWATACRYGGGAGGAAVQRFLAHASQTLPNFLFAGALHSPDHTAAYCEADVFLTPTRNNEVGGCVRWVHGWVPGCMMRGAAGGV